MTIHQQDGNDGGEVDAERLGEAIRKAREDQKIGQRELARRSGTDPGYLARIESGKQQPGLNTLRRLATALGISESKLLNA